MEQYAFCSPLGAGTVPATAPARERAMANQIDEGRSTFHHAKIGDSISPGSSLATFRAEFIDQPGDVARRCTDQLKAAMDESRKRPANIPVMVCRVWRLPRRL